MIFEQIYLGCLAQASYFIGDETTGEAAVVDPRRDIGEYLDLAEEHGLTIRHAVLTHFHADFASGHLELREKCGATIYVGAAAQAEYPCTPLADGDTIEMGQVRLQALATPGHTPESISILLFDRAKSETDPHAVLTGDTMFIGDVGRPDLMAAVGVTAEDMAAQLYDSLHEKLMTLPAETMVYPGHGAGAMCGKNLSSETFSTIGQQLAENCALQSMERDEFVAMLTANQPQVPAYFGYDAGYNKREHPTLDETAEKAACALSVGEFLAQREAGAQVLDTRSADAYCRAHLRGSVDVGLGGKFATWCGTVLDADRPILIVADPGREAEAIMRLGRIGFDQVAGYIDGGFAALADCADVVCSTGRVTAAEFPSHLRALPGGFLLDVRTPGEYENGAIEGNTFIPLNQLRDRLDEVPKDQDISIYCGGGYRSAIAVGLLEGAGHRSENLVDMIGGWAAWQQDSIVRLTRRLDRDTVLHDREEVCSAVKETLMQEIHANSLVLPEEFLRLASDGYARHLLHKTDRYTVVVMVWNEGQGTPIHDHDGKWCVECVYQGTIRVVSYDLIGSPDDELVAFRKEDEIYAGRGMAGALIPPFDYHVIENPHADLAVTIHVYGGEMEGCDTFQPVAGDPARANPVAGDPARANPVDGDRYRRVRKQLSYT